MLKNVNLNLHSHNKLLSRLLIIFKNIVMLLFIGLIFFFSISLFSKTNNKIIEGNCCGAGSWFESAASRRRRRAEEEARRQAMIDKYNRCLNPTAENWYDCGPKYYFPEKHLEAGAQEVTNAFERKQNSSKQPDKGMTTSLNNTVKQY